METIIQIILIILAVYAAIGFAFGVFFFVWGAKRIDPLIADSRWTVRLLLVPGAMAVWPLLILKLLASNRNA